MKLLSLLVIPILAGALIFAVASYGHPPPNQLSHPSARSFAVAASGTNSVWWVGASSTDASALPNTGVQGAIQVISAPVVGCLVFWVSDDLSNNEWGQVGYYLCNSSTPTAFYEIWNLNTNTVLTSGSAPVTTGYHTFSMYLQSGTTWVYTLDGSPLGTYDMGASTSSPTYPVYALSEEQGTSVFGFPSVTFSTAMMVVKSGAWQPVENAVSYGSSWGVQGVQQNSALKSNEVVVGGSLPIISVGTSLWSSPGPTSTTSTATFPAPASTVTATTTATITSVQTTTVGTTATITQVPPTVTNTVTTVSTLTQPPVTTTATNTIYSTHSQTFTSVVTSFVTSSVASTVTQVGTVTGTSTASGTAASPSTTTLTTTHTQTQSVVSTLTAVSTVMSFGTTIATSFVTLPTTTTATVTSGATSTQTHTVTSIVTTTSPGGVTATVTSAGPTVTISKATTVFSLSVSPTTITQTITLPQTVTVTVTPAQTSTQTQVKTTSDHSEHGAAAAIVPEGSGASQVPIISDAASALVISSAGIAILAIAIRRYIHS